MATIYIKATQQFTYVVYLALHLETSNMLQYSWQGISKVYNRSYSLNIKYVAIFDTMYIILFKSHKMAKDTMANTKFYISSFFYTYFLVKNNTDGNILKMNSATVFKSVWIYINSNTQLCFNILLIMFYQNYTMESHK